MMKTLLVTGGKDSQENLLSSTEINVDPAWHASVWSFAAPLPSARYDFPAASLDNSVFVFGQFYFNCDLSCWYIYPYTQTQPHVCLSVSEKVYDLVLSFFFCL